MKLLEDEWMASLEHEKGEPPDYGRITTPYRPKGVDGRPVDCPRCQGPKTCKHIGAGHWACTACDFTTLPDVREE